MPALIMNKRTLKYVLILMLVLNTRYVYSFKKINNINSQSSKNNKDKDLLQQIIAKTSNDNSNLNSNTQTQSIELRKKIFSLISNIVHIDSTKSTCTNRILQSDVQAEMKRLKSFLSTCSGYCRLAMSPDGTIYPAKDFNLESMLSFFLQNKKIFKIILIIRTNYYFSYMDQRRR
jgi:hypothetical protein